jgi:N12 class adenine-specific DNA methylase
MDATGGKLSNIRKLLFEANKSVSENGESWKAFLESATRIYKYKYADQLLILAQRPDATACAAFETWNEPGIARYIKKGAKGIAIIDEAAGRKKYVFDIADTQPAYRNPNKEEPQKWKYEESKHAAAVNKALADTYETKSDIFDEKITEIAGIAADKILSNEAGGMERLSRDENVSKLIASSVQYSVLERCGIENKLGPEDFNFISNLSSDEIKIIGSTVSLAAKEILNYIEKAVRMENRRIRTEERGEEYGTAIRGREGRDALPDIGYAGTTPDRAVGTRGDDIHDETQETASGQNDHRRDVERLSRGFERDLSGEDRHDDGVVAENASRARQVGSDGVGGPHEQPPRPSGSDDSTGTDIHGGLGNATEEIQLPKAKSTGGETERDGKAAQALPSQAGKPYRAGDEVYLDDGNRYRIERIEPDSVMLQALGLDAGFIVAFRDLYTDDFERQLRGNIFNQGVLDRARTATIAPESSSENQTLTPVPGDGSGAQEMPQSEDRASVPVGQNVLLPTVYDKNGNFNRDGKRRRVTAAEPIGRYQIYTTEAIDSTDLLAWVMTDSGRLMQLGTLNHLDADENALDRGFANAVRDVEESLNDTSRWVDYNSAAIADRLKEADEHNAPIREARTAQYDEEDAERAAAHEREKLEREKAFENAVDEIGGTIVNGERADIPSTFDKNPLLALFDLYEINVPLRTKGWVNKHVRALQLEKDGALRVWGDAKEVSTVFFKAIKELNEAILEASPEQQRAAMKTSIEDIFRNTDIASYSDEWQPAQARIEGVQTVEPGEISQASTENAGGAMPPSAEEIEQGPFAAPTEPMTRTNYRIESDDHGAFGGAKTRFKNNVEAIATLKLIESENRLATPQEQETLSKFVGWGGISEAFDANKEAWSREYSELKNLLTEEEYVSARKTTLNAHYTSPAVIRNIYDAIGSMGFENGNILEPSMGIGNFFGLVPEKMQGSKLYGIELDSVTGRIAKQLYQKANISVQGYETTKFPDNFFDVAVGNVPFGDFGVHDRAYAKNNFLIHDYFFAKTLDKVRPGGIVAFVTSKGTMDKKNGKARSYLAERAELLGAVRLPNNAFKDNAGTEVTTDILFLQKLETPREKEAEWIHVNRDEKGILMNEYFIDHPEMILGEMVQEMTMYGNPDETTCKPFEGADLNELLTGAIEKISGEYRERAAKDEAAEDVIEEKQYETIPADPETENFTFTVAGEDVYYRENSVMYKLDDLKETEKNRIKGLIKLRGDVRELLEYQLEDYSDYEISEKQKELNDDYDSFTKEYGLISSRANSLVFRDDSSYYLLSSLEILNEDKELERKADIFTKRTISKNIPVERVETSEEALAVSISEKAGADIEYMEKLTGFDEEKIAQDLEGIIFINPENPLDGNGRNRYESADKYLSGNVRKKLEEARKAAETEPRKYAVNIRKLEESQPNDLTATEIEVRLGAAWIEPKYIKQFIDETLEPSFSTTREMEVEYAPINSSWHIKGKKGDYEWDNPKVYSVYGTDYANAFKIIEDSLNLRETVITKTVDIGGQPRTVVNEEETAAAQARQELIKQEFKDWIFKDTDRRAELVKTYNEKFNSDRPRTYDGSHIRFVGKNPEIELMGHQKNAIARVLYGGNTLLAHEVGAGKTFEMIASAMESKRLGLCKKSMFVVPNHLTEQTASEILRLYPKANVLVTTEKDFETKKRKRFCGRIATGDYDIIVIGHSQFEKIPISNERQQKYIREQIEDITEAVDEMKMEKQGRSYSVKQMEKMKMNLEVKLTDLKADEKKDKGVTFEQLGVDRIFVDEAHGYKNLFLFTKMQNIAGISKSAAQKSTDMYLKTQYLDETTGGKGVIFATGTPVSNSMCEMYTMMRYLQRDTLKERGMEQFDAWAANFGDTETAVELAPEGNGVRAKTRFSRFYNLPELMNMFSEVADIKTADSLALDRPEVEFHNVSVPPSEEQEVMVKRLSERAAAVHKRKVKPNEDNMLAITTDGRKIGLDQRLMNPLFPDNPDSKVNKCVENAYGIWEETKKEKSTQLIFCDYSTPKSKTDEFDVYNDVKKKLIERSIPEKEIAFIHDAKTETQKKELFAKVRKGKVRILMGSTQKMGTGTNVQDRLIAIHDLDCPWRPADLEQRLGRMMRQGNQNGKTHCYRYVTEKTFDAYLFQTLENKQKFIGQIMTSKNPGRSCEDLDGTALSYAEIKSLCAGDERIQEKMNLDIEVRKLRMRKTAYMNNLYSLQDDIKFRYPSLISTATKNLESYKKDLGHVAENTDDSNEEKFSPMTLGAKIFTKKDEAGKELIEFIKKAGVDKEINAGIYRGMSMKIYYDMAANGHILELRREKNAPPHKVSLGADATGNITRINNEIKRIPDKIEYNRQRVEELTKHFDEAKKETKKPFPQEEELKAKMARLAALDIELNLDRKTATQENSADGDDQGNSAKDDGGRNEEIFNSPKEESKRSQSDFNWADEVKNEPFARGYGIFRDAKIFGGLHKDIECLKSTSEYCVLKITENKLLILDNIKLGRPMKEGASYQFGIKAETGAVLLVKEMTKENEAPRDRTV